VSLREKSCTPWRAHSHESLRGKAIEGGSLSFGSGALQGQRDQLAVAQVKELVLESEPLGQEPGDLGGAPRLAGRRDGALVQRKVVETPRSDEVFLLEHRGGRQHDVGMACSVGQELLVDHREKVVAAESLQHLALFRRDDRGVGAPDEERADRRLQFRIGQMAPELDHVESARRRRAKIGPHELGDVR